MLFRDPNHNQQNVRYIFCTACYIVNLPRNHPSQRLDQNELKDAIYNGVNTRKAIFSYRLISSENSAMALGKSWSYHNQLKNNYWIIALRMSDLDYDQYRKKNRGIYNEIGTYLHPLLEKIIYCKNADDEKIILKEEINHPRCAIL